MTVFDEFIPVGDKKNKHLITVFENYSIGLKTSVTLGVTTVRKKS